MIKEDKNFIKLETKTNSLVLEIINYDDPRTSFNKNKKIVIQNYFGPSSLLDEIKETKSIIGEGGSNDEYNLHNLISSSFGIGNNSETSILLKNSDGTFTNRFFFDSYQIIDGDVFCPGPHSRDVCQTLDIIEKDDVLGLELHHYYSIFKDSDVIAVKKKLINNGTGDCVIHRLFSLECSLPSRDLKVYTFDGKWLYERNRHEVSLNSGIFAIDSKIGSSSHKHNPFIEIFDKTNNLYYGFNFIYSGNHKEVVDVNSLFHSSVMVGINDYGFEYKLKPGEAFTTPEAIMVVQSSIDEITLAMHDFVSNHIVNPKFRNKLRPIIFNNWEGTGMNINENNLSEMAVIASKVGVEQFVMDDGWFYKRNDSLRGLGDWFIDKEKFPNGLKPFADNIRKLGMKFGIWVEPEMININTELFKKHPEYACIIPNREPIEKRNQLMIDMSNPHVIDYLYDCLSSVFIETQAEYVKWDYNRYLIDSYSSIKSDKDYAYNFMMGTYSLIERLQKKFPDILFESCSSGGGRYDLGMIYYMPQTWGSDDTNTYCRSFIACGTLIGYPQSTYGAHVSVDGCPLPNRNARSSLEDRFNLSAFGAFGYEFDFRKFEEKELGIIAKQIEYYKKHKALFQFGKLYIIDNCFDDERYFSMMTVSKDYSEAMMYISELDKNYPSHIWKAKGLDKNATYHVSMREQYNIEKKDIFEKDVNGQELMEKGINLGTLFDKNSDGQLYNGIYSRLLYLKKVN